MKVWILKLMTGLLVFATLDSLITNWLISHDLAIEANPLMVPFAGTYWLPAIKIGWVVLMISLILIVIKLNKRKEGLRCPISEK